MWRRNREWCGQAGNPQCAPEAGTEEGKGLPTAGESDLPDLHRRLRLYCRALVYLRPCSPLPWRYDLQVFLKRVNVALRSGSVTLTLFFFICILFLAVAIHFLSWISLESVSQGP